MIGDCDAFVGKIGIVDEPAVVTVEVRAAIIGRVAGAVFARLSPPNDECEKQSEIRTSMHLNSTLRASILKAVCVGS